MKRSELDVLVHRREVLLRKIQAYEKVRRAINDLAQQFLDDPYALEALSAVDRNLFNILVFMHQGLATIEKKLKEVYGGVEHK